MIHQKLHLVGEAFQERLHVCERFMSTRESTRTRGNYRPSLIGLHAMTGAAAD